MRWALERKKHALAVGTTAAPNLANKGKRAGKSIPLSQILTPPVVDPESGFTSVRVGVRSPSLFGGEVAWLRGSMMITGAEPGSAFGGG